MDNVRSIDKHAQRRTLIVVASSQLLVLTLWFSASAVAPQLQSEWGLSVAAVAWLTLAVQIGFVLGALTSAFFNLPDLIPARRMFFMATLVAVAANSALVLLSGSALVPATVLRLIVGVSLAGVYPAGLKVVSGWFDQRRGMALGVLVGALTIGSALPHLVRGTGLDWRPVILVSSVLAAIGGVLMLKFVTDGPYDTAPSRFSIKLVGSVVANKGVRLSTYGYLGHMWELYAMWTWTAAFLFASAEAGGVLHCLGIGRDVRHHRHRRRGVLVGRIIGRSLRQGTNRRWRNGDFRSDGSPFAPRLRCQPVSRSRTVRCVGPDRCGRFSTVFSSCDRDSRRQVPRNGVDPSNSGRVHADPRDDPGSARNR
jgi:MFS family permease